MPTLPILTHLENFKQQHGEDAFRVEVTRLAKNAIRTGPKHAAFWEGVVEGMDWLDWDSLVAEAETEPKAEPSVSPNVDPSSPDMNQQMMEAMRQKLPGLKTQAQLNAFFGAFEALQMTLNAIFEGADAAQVEVGQKALNLALEVAVQATGISQQLEEMPEAATSEAAEEFKTPASDFNEYDKQRQLMLELEGIGSVADLNSWYESTAEARNGIKSQGLRNPLLDAIRKKKLSLS